MPEKRHFALLDKGIILRSCLTQLRCWFLVTAPLLAWRQWRGTSPTSPTPCKGKSHPWSRSWWWGKKVGERSTLASGATAPSMHDPKKGRESISNQKIFKIRACVINSSECYPKHLMWTFSTRFHLIHPETPSGQVSRLTRWENKQELICFRCVPKDEMTCALQCPGIYRDAPQSSWWRLAFVAHTMLCGPHKNWEI